jgi:hypothetical protein
MSPLADQPVRAGHPADRLPTVPLPSRVLPVRPVGYATDASPLHGWGTPVAAPAPPAWGWATVRGDGKSWAVAGAPSLRRPPRRAGLLREWGRRYLLAEGIGTLCALTAALVVHTATGSLATAAVAASVAESAAYYAVVLRRLLPGLWARNAGLPFGRRVVRTARDTAGEASDFLTAELLDTVLLRPLLIWLAAGWTGSHVVWGLLLGKLLADLGFYAVVIPSYELRKRMATR